MARISNVFIEVIKLNSIFPIFQKVKMTQNFENLLKGEILSYGY